MYKLVYTKTNEIYYVIANTIFNARRKLSKYLGVTIDKIIEPTD
jgi:hypothetical protein